MDSPIPLVPDDQDRQENVLLVGKRTAPVQPYALTALMAAMALLLVNRALLTHGPWWTQYGGALAGGVLVYLLLSGARASLPLLFLTIVAAELGLLYSMPFDKLFLTTQSNFIDIVNLVVHSIGAILTGIIFGRLLSVEEDPRAVITFTFLFMFVLVNLCFLFIR